MAKTVGALFSLEASGTVGKTVTYSKNRGVRQARLRIIPRNPRTEGQAHARTVMRFIGAMVSRINTGRSGKRLGDLSTIKAFLIENIILPNTWNSQFMQSAFPNSSVVFAADLVIYDALTADQKTAWATFNDALGLPFAITIGAPGDERSFDEQFAAFIFTRGLARAGYLAALPTDVPPEWDNT